MRNRDYHQVKRKHDIIDDLMSKKKAGVKQVHRTLTEDDLTVVEKFFSIKPEKIIIFTQKLGNPYYIRENLLKTIHFSYIRGEKTVLKNYNKAICQLLKEQKIRYKIKYLIILN